MKRRMHHMTTTLGLERGGVWVWAMWRGVPQDHPSYTTPHLILYIPSLSRVLFPYKHPFGHTNLMKFGVIHTNSITHAYSIYLMLHRENRLAFFSFLSDFIQIIQRRRFHRLYELRHRRRGCKLVLIQL